MKKNIDKKDLVAKIKDRFSASDSVILINYRGLTVKESEELRQTLRDAEADMKIYKNTLTDIAMRELELPSMEQYLEGPTAFVFAVGEPNASAKAIADFAKKHEVLEIKAGLVDGEVVDTDHIKAIAALPTRDELLAKVLGTMKNPMANFARVIDAIAKKKQEEEAAA